MSLVFLFLPPPFFLSLSLLLSFGRTVVARHDIPYGGLKTLANNEKRARALSRDNFSSISGPLAATAFDVDDKAKVGQCAGGDLEMGSSTARAASRFFGTEKISFRVLRSSCYFRDLKLTTGKLTNDRYTTVFCNEQD